MGLLGTMVVSDKDKITSETIKKAFDFKELFIQEIMSVEKRLKRGKKAEDDTRKCAEKVFEKYGARIKSGELKACHLGAYGLNGGGSIKEIIGSIAVYGKTEYME